MALCKLKFSVTNTALFSGGAKVQPLTLVSFELSNGNTTKHIDFVLVSWKNLNFHGMDIQGVSMHLINLVPVHYRYRLDYCDQMTIIITS